MPAPRRIPRPVACTADPMCSRRALLSNQTLRVVMECSIAQNASSPCGRTAETGAAVLRVTFLLSTDPTLEGSWAKSWYELLSNETGALQAVTTAIGTQHGFSSSLFAMALCFSLIAVSYTHLTLPTKA